MNINNKNNKFIARQTYYFHFGHHFASKINILLQLTIIAKLFNLGAVYYVGAIFIGGSLLWLFGFVLDRLGIIDEYVKRVNRGMITEIKNKKGVGV